MNVAVLLSGGVDSSVALYKTIQLGYSAHCYYLKVWSENDSLFAGNCPWEEDLYYAKSVCKQLGVPLSVVPFQKEYYDRIISHTISELKSGATPSPDVFCNQRIKFGAFFDYLSKHESKANKIITGHYAKIKKYQSVPYVYRAHDATKDQSYFLSYLSNKQLNKLHFPLGTLTKQQVRSIALKHHLVTAGKPDSQGLCFLGSISYQQFIEHYLGKRSGNIINIQSGKVVGTHQGYWFYTIGQRKGLILTDGPWYVVDKDIDSNIVYVDNKCLAVPHRTIYLQTTWNNHRVYEQLPNYKHIVIKYRHAPQVCRATLRFVDTNGCSLTIESPTTPLAVGQQVALYVGKRCIGAGRIASG